MSELSLVELAAPGQYGTDKVQSGYLPLYERLLHPLRHRDVRLLELGVLDGGSLRLWRDYLERGLVVGVDLRRPDLVDEPRLRMYAGRQDDAELLRRVASETAPAGFDVIIDDCSHLGATTEASFNILFDHHLTAGGLYVIEDWGTGYRAGWPDGAPYTGPRRWRSRLQPHRLASHDHGMVGFVKRLVDEVGRPDQGRPTRGIAFVEIYPGVVVVRKAPG